MIDVCIKLLRFEASSTSAPVLLAHARSASEAARKVCAALRRDAMVQRDREIESEIERVLPVLDYIVAAHDCEPAKAKNALIASVTNMLNVVQDYRKDYGVRAQQMGAILKNVNRAARFLSQTGRMYRPTELAEESPSWQSRLRDTFAFVGRSKNKRLRREFEQFVALLDGTDQS